jgi:hypothetical protein
LGDEVLGALADPREVSHAQHVGVRYARQGFKAATAADAGNIGELSAGLEPASPSFRWNFQGATPARIWMRRVTKQLHSVQTSERDEGSRRKPL